MDDVDMSDMALCLRGEGLVRYIQRVLLVREHFNQSLTAPSTDEQLFAAALMHITPQEAPTVVTAPVPQHAAYWFCTGRRAYIMLAAYNEASYHQGVMLLGYHLLRQSCQVLASPAICSPFETALWRSPAFFWPRFFYHCLTAGSAYQRLQQPA